MTQLNNAMEIFKILPRTNCRDCSVPTCFAFAAAVFKGEKRLADCLHIDKDALETFSVGNSDSRTLEREEIQALKHLRRKISGMDLASSAERLGASFSDEKLTVKCLGKDFHVDSQGNVTSEVHVHGWVTIPLLNYVISCAGKDVSGNWVPMRELKNGATWAGLFGQRCEKPLKRVADNYTDLFEHMVQIFNAKRAPNAFDSDVAVILHPSAQNTDAHLLLETGWRHGVIAECLFRRYRRENLVIDSLYRIATGMVMMFEKIALTHGK